MSICPGCGKEFCGPDIEDAAPLTAEQITAINRQWEKQAAAKVKKEWRSLLRSKPDPVFDKKLMEKLFAR